VKLEEIRKRLEGGDLIGPTAEVRERDKVAVIDAIDVELLQGEAPFNCACGAGVGLGKYLLRRPTARNDFVIGHAGRPVVRYRDGAVAILCGTCIKKLGQAGFKLERL